MALQVPLSEKDHYIGQLNSPLRLVEYGDFECPHCRAAYPIVEAIIARSGSQLCFAYRHFPLREVHPHAEHAALAAEAAGRQKRFWQMHHIIFEHQDALADENLLFYASELELDMDQFVGDIGDPVLLQKVRDDFRSGLKSGVNGTPTFFINGQRFNGQFHLLEDALAIQGELRL